MVRVEYHADLKEVQSDARLAAWLSPEFQTAPFDRLDWWVGLSAHCGITPLLAVARADESIAVLPLHADNGTLTGLSNWYTFRYRPLITGERGKALLAGIARDLKARARRVTLTGVADEDGSAGILEAAFRAAGWVCLRRQSDTNHILPVNRRTYAQFLESRPGQLRTTLKRKSRRVGVEVTDRFDSHTWDSYEAIYAESWKPQEGSPAFLRNFAETEGKAGRLRMGMARAGGDAIAAQFWTVEAGTAFIHKLAHRDAAKQLSPGSVLSAAMFRHVIDVDKVDLVDFGTGDDPYKRDWMEAQRPRYTLDFMLPHAPQNWITLAKHHLTRLARDGNHG